jgi:hypothetical protein
MSFDMKKITVCLAAAIFVLGAGCTKHKAHAPREIFVESGNADDKEPAAPATTSPRLPTPDANDDDCDEGIKYDEPVDGLPQFHPDCAWAERSVSQDGGAFTYSVHLTQDRSSRLDVDWETSLDRTVVKPAVGTVYLGPASLNYDEYHDWARPKISAAGLAGDAFSTEEIQMQVADMTFSKVPDREGDVMTVTLHLSNKYVKDSDASKQRDVTFELTAPAVFN